MNRWLYSALTTLIVLTTPPGMALAASEPVQPLRGGMVSLGGELELEFIKSENNDASGNNSNSRFSIDKVVLTPKAEFSEHITFQSDIEAEPDKPIKVDEAWVNFGGLPFDTWIKIGLEDIFMKPHRKTESYPITGHAFWQDEDLGVFIGGDHGLVYWRASATNGRRLKDRRIQEDDVYPIPTDDDDNTEKNSNKQVGAGLGVDIPVGEIHGVDILVFGYNAKLSMDDIAYLQGIAGYGGSDDDVQRRYGVNVELTAGSGTIFFQILQGTDGDLDRLGWYVQPSYKIILPGRTVFTSIEPLVRFEQYTVDMDHDPTDSRTWDRQTTTLAAIIEIVKNLNLKLEYYINGEDTGNSDVDNDEFLAQLEARL